MSGNRDELPESDEQPEGSARERQQQTRSQIAERTGVDPESIAVRDTREGIRAELRGDGPDQFRASVRERAAGESDAIEPGDISPGVDLDALTADPSIRPDRREAVAERAREQAASDDEYLRPADVSAEVGGTGITDVAVTEAGAQRRARRAAAADSDQFAPDDFRVSGGEVAVRDDALRQAAASDSDQFNPGDFEVVETDDARQAQVRAAALREQAASQTDQFGVADITVDDGQARVTDDALRQAAASQTDQFDADDFTLGDDRTPTVTDAALREQAASQTDQFNVDDFRVSDTDEGRQPTLTEQARAQAEQQTVADLAAGFDGVAPEDITVEDGQAQLPDDALQTEIRRQQRQRVAEQLDAFGADDLEIVGGEPQIRDSALREQAASGTDRFGPDDFEVVDTDSGQQARLVDDVLRQAAASDRADFDPADFEVVEQNGQQQARLTEGALAEQAASEFDPELPDVDVSPGDITVTRSDSGVETAVADDVLAAQQAEDLLDATNGLPVGQFDTPGSAAAEVIAQEQDIDQRVVINDALERSGAGDLNPRYSDPIEITAALEPEAVRESIDVFGRDDEQTAPFRERFVDGTIADEIAEFDAELAQRRQLAEENPQQFLSEVDTDSLEQLRENVTRQQNREIAQFRAERDARVEAANELDEELPDQDIDSSDIELEDGTAQLDPATVETIEREREQQAREQAAEQFDAQFDNAAISEDEITFEGGQATLTEDAQQEVEAAQEFALRRDAAEQLDSQLDRDIDIGDVQVDRDGSELAAGLAPSTEQAIVSDRRDGARQDIAADLGVEPDAVQFDGEQAQLDRDAVARTVVADAAADLRQQDLPEGVNAGADDIDVSLPGEGETISADALSGVETSLDTDFQRSVAAAQIDAQTPSVDVDASDLERTADGAFAANVDAPQGVGGGGIAAPEDVEASPVAETAADVGQFARESVLPAGASAALDVAADSFRDGRGAAATDTAVQELEPAAQRIDTAVDTGIGVSADVTDDIVTGATPLPDAATDTAFDTIEGGAEIGAASLNPARIAQDTARAPELTIRGVDAATDADAAENIQRAGDVTADVGETVATEGPAFVRENPQQSAEYAIGGTIAIGGGALAGTAATRGATGAARGARRALDDIDVDASGRTFVSDDRGQLDIGRSGQRSSDEVAALEELDELDTGTTSQADDDISVSADEVLGEFEDPEDVAVTATQQRASSIAAQREGREAARRFGTSGIDEDVTVSDVLGSSEDVDDVDVSTLRQRAASIQEQRRSQRAAEIREQQQQPARDFGFDDSATPAVREATDPISRRQAQEFAAAGSAGADGATGLGLGLGAASATEAARDAIAGSPTAEPQQTTQQFEEQVGVSGVGAGFAVEVGQQQAETTTQLERQATAQAQQQALGLESQQTQRQTQQTVQQQLQQQQQVQTQLQQQLQLQQQQQVQLQDEFTTSMPQSQPQPEPRPRARPDPEGPGGDDAPFTFGTDADDDLFDSGIAEAEDILDSDGGSFFGSR